MIDIVELIKLQRELDWCDLQKWRAWNKLRNNTKISQNDARMNIL